MSILQQVPTLFPFVFNILFYILLFIYLFLPNFAINLFALSSIVYIILILFLMRNCLLDVLYFWYLYRSVDARLFHTRINKTTQIVIIVSIVPADDITCSGPSEVQPMVEAGGDDL